MTLNERLTELRNKKGLSKRELSLHFGLEQSTYGKYELGQRQPSLEILQQLADFFEVSTDYLLGLTDNPSQKNEDTQKSLTNSEALDYLNQELSKLDINVENGKEVKTLLNFIKDNRATLKVLLSAETNTDKSQLLDFKDISDERVTIKKIARSSNNSLPSEMTLDEQKLNALNNAPRVTSDDDL